MAVSADFIEYIYEQVAPAGAIRHKRMFGGCIVYCDEKPALLVCDNTV